MVGYHVPGGERPVEAQSVEAGEPAERHVRLSGGEQGAGAKFDARVAERFALAFVDGDRPCGFERELTVGADGPGFQAGAGLPSSPSPLSSSLSPSFPSLSGSTRTGLSISHSWGYNLLD